MRAKQVILTLAACAGLAACGDTLGEQAIGGAAIGAGTAVVTGNSALQGAALGAGANVVACQTELVDCN